MQRVHNDLWPGENINLLIAAALKKRDAEE
jgi:hypothetical protein